jgi:2,3-bisphosphoglycerate-independent phosphoglycerate mutase
MKYLVVIGDGMADEPLPELGGKTPLEHARTPVMDRLASEGSCGLLATVPPGFEPGSDIANLGVLGYDPAACYTGRGPLEAANMGVELGPSDVAYRCNLVTVIDGRMTDFTAGHVSSAEAGQLLADLQQAVPGVLFQSGVSYRNLLVVRDGGGCRSVPPHDIAGQEIGQYLPTGPDAGLLLGCMATSRHVFSGHRVNQARIGAGKAPVTQVWPWSGGKKPRLQAFSERWGKTGGVISAVDLVNGIARVAGMETVRVPGATGFLDTDYGAKGRYCIEALKRLDFLYLHVEAPDEAGHMGDLDEKILAIERLDTMIGGIMESFEGIVAVLPDHPTPVRVRTHTATPVPFLVYGKGRDATRCFSEKEAERGSLGLMQATSLLPFLFG